MTISPISLRRIVWVCLFGAVVLLVWPIAPDTPLWDMPGVFGGGSSGVEFADIVTPISALVSGESLGDGGDRLQLAVGLLLLGFTLGAGLASVPRTRVPVAGDAQVLEPHGAFQP